MTYADDTAPFHRRLAGWRIAGWSAAAALLALPAIAMQLDEGVHWTTGDFAAAGIMLLVTGLAAEGGLRIAQSWPHLIALALAIFTAFFTVWSNLAVGIVGSEDAAVNAGFFILLALATGAAALQRFRPRAMSIIAGLLGIGQFALGLAAQRMTPGHDVEWGVIALFAALWIAASLFFRVEAREGQIRKA